MSGSLESCCWASREHRFPSDWQRECWEDRKHRRGRLERQGPPTQLSGSLDKGKKGLFRDTSASLFVSIFATRVVWRRSTLLEELRYAISLSGGREEKKQSIIIAAIVGCQLTLAPLPLGSHKAFKIKGSPTKKQKPTHPTVPWVPRSGTAC